MSSRLNTVIFSSRLPIHSHCISENFLSSRSCRLLILLNFLLFLGLLWSFVSLSHAEDSDRVALTAEERAWLDNNPEKLTLLFNTEFPPIEFISSSGEFTGLGADIIAMVEKRLGVTFRKRSSHDWNQLLSDLEGGTCAIAPAIVAKPERQQYIFFTSPYAKVPLVIITKNTERKNLTLSSLTGRRVAAVSGYATETYLRDKARDRFEVVPVPTVTDGVRVVSLGQVDAFVGNLAVAAYHIEKEGIPNLRVAGNTDYVFEWSIGVSRKYPLLCSSFDKAFNTIPKSEMETICRRWISLNVGSWLDPEMLRFLQVAGVFSVLLLTGLTGITFFLKRRLNEKVANLKSSQQNLLDKSELLRLATEATQAGVWDYRPVIQMTYLSTPWYTMLGYEPTDNEVTTAEFREFVHPGDQASMTLAFESYISRGGHGQLEAEFRLRRADGSWCWVLSRGKTVEWDEQGEPIRIIGLDVNIQSLNEAQEKMNQSEERFRTLFMDAPVPMVNVTLTGELIAVNDHFSSVLGYVIEEIPDMDSWWETINPDPEYRQRVKSSWEKKVKQALENHSGVEPDEYRVTCKNGTVLTMVIGASVIGDTILISLFDITERKQAAEEREKLQGQLHQSKKLEAVGILAGGVAHDFNNMLGVIMGYTEITLGDMAPEEPFRKNLDRILDAAQRSANLTRQLLTFARKQTIEPVVFDLNESIEAILKMVRRLIGENIELAWLPGTGRCTVKMDPTQLDQILINLCVNARDAIENVGKVTIETDIVSFDETYCESHSDFVPRDYVLLSIRDDGPGMGNDTLNHIFEPFFTTKGLGKGTGMGLATVYGIVKQNDGVIAVNSEQGKGTTFRIYIPLNSAEEVTARPDLIEGVPLSQGETILIVEDDPNLLELIMMMLEQLNYAVIPAGTPREAIQAAEENSSDIHMFITDVVMPEMNGRELAERLQIIRPKIKHLFMSGYTADLIAHQGVLDEGVNFIQKPFSLKDMAVKIRGVLD